MVEVALQVAKVAHVVEVAPREDESEIVDTTVVQDEVFGLQADEQEAQAESRDSTDEHKERMVDEAEVGHVLCVEGKVSALVCWAGAPQVVSKEYGAPQLEDSVREVNLSHAGDKEHGVRVSHVKGKENEVESV